MSRVAVSTGLALMLTCWVAPWAVVIGWWTEMEHPRALLSAPSVLALVLVGAVSSFVLGRWVWRGPRSRVARLGVVAVGVLAVLVVERIEQYQRVGPIEWLAALITAIPVAIGQPTAPALALVVGLLLWYRGVQVGAQMPTYSDLESAFKWGIAMLVSFGLITSLTTQAALLPALQAATTPYFVAFFFVGLLTLALGRLETLRTRTRALAVNGQWLAVLISVVGAVVLSALLLGQLLSFDLLVLATRPLFEAIGSVLIMLMYIVVIPLAYVLELLVYALLALVRGNLNQPPPQPPAPSDVDAALQRWLSLGFSPELILALKTVGAAIVLAIGLVVIARAAARWRPSSADADATEEQRDSMWEPDRLRHLLLGWLRRLLRRGRSTAPDLAATASPPQMDTPTSGGSVRELYRELLRVGQSTGATRAPATTPFEHLPALERSLAPAAALATLTSAYVEVRYAEQHPSAATETSLRRALDSVHALDTS